MTPRTAVDLTHTITIYLYSTKLVHKTDLRRPVVLRTMYGSHSYTEPNRRLDAVAAAAASLRYNAEMTLNLFTSHAARFYIGARGHRPPNLAQPLPQFLIGSIVISLSRCCLPNDEGPGSPNIFS